MKKYFVLFLAFVLCISFAACGNSAATAPAAAPAESPTSAPTQAPAAPTQAPTEAPSETVVEIAWPEEPVEFVIPANPGGDTDLTSRALAASLTETLGETVSVLNMGGGAGTIAINELMQRDADGYSALYWHGDLVLGSLLGRFGSDWRDMFDICAVCGGGGSTAIIVKASSPWQTIEELFEYVKEHPGEVSVGTETGASTHMMLVEIENQGGLEFNIVNVGNAADRTTALLGGDIDINITSYGSAAAYIESGDMRCLALLAEERAEGLDIPTLKEAVGIDTAWVHFYVVAFPKGTDPAIIDKMAAAIQEDAYKEGYTEILAKYYYKPNVRVGEEAVEYLETQEARLQSLVDQYNARYN